MRKRKFAGGIVALCLVLSVAGCGKTSEEKQAANYYQKELGLDKDEAEELAHEIYGNDEDEEKPSVTAVPEEPKETVVEPLPELLNSEWYDCKVQIYDMVFNYAHMTEEEIRKIVAGSAYDVELTEGFDKNGEVCLKHLKIEGIGAAIEKVDNNSKQLHGEYGLLSDEYCYKIDWTNFCLYDAFDRSLIHFRGEPNVSLSYGEESTCWYDKASIEIKDFKDLKTRENVLAYLSENGFVEVKEEQAPYYRATIVISPEYHKEDIEFVDTPHYFCKGVQSISVYRIHKLGETDQMIDTGLGTYYSGARLNLVNCVTFSFNTDGTISSIEARGSSKTQDAWVLGKYPVDIREVEILGEIIPRK